jgi:hypothetical protein
LSPGHKRKKRKNNMVRAGRVRERESFERKKYGRGRIKREGEF